MTDQERFEMPTVMFSLTERDCMEHLWRLVAVVFISKDGKILRTSPKLDDMFGYARNELVGKLIETLVPDGAKELHPTLRDGYFRNPMSRPMMQARVVQGQHRGGTSIPVVVKLDSSWSADGQQQYGIALVVEASGEQKL